MSGRDDTLVMVSAVASGPGRLGRDGVASAVLFDTSNGIVERDLFAAFWLEEAPGLDWLLHFLCNAEMDALVALLASPEEEDEDEEVLYSRSYLTTLGSEVIDGP